MLNFKRVHYYVILLVMVVLSFPLPPAFTEDAMAGTDWKLLELKLKFEKELENKVQSILDRTLGSDNARVTGLSIELNIERKEQRKEAARGTREETKTPQMEAMEFLLPGVPMPQTPKQSKPVQDQSESAGSGEVKVIIPSMINKMKCTVMISTEVAKNNLLVTQVRDVIVDSLDMNFDRGDELNIMSVPFIPAPSMWRQFMDPKIFVPTMLGLLFLLFLYSFLPSSVKQIANAFREGKASEISINAKTEQAGAQAAGAAAGGIAGALTGEAGALSAGEEKEKKGELAETQIHKRFSFVNKDNLKNLIYLLLEEPPEIIAVVLTSLDAELSGEVITSLPAELQMRVALAMTQVRLTSAEDFARLEEDFKKKIDFLVGGIDSFVQILDQVDMSTRAEMLAVLEEQSPRLSARVRELIFVFEDIEKMSDQSVQTVIRELSPAQLAVCLRGNIPPPVIDKIMNNMSEGGRAMLKEEMEFGRPVIQTQVEEERRRVEKIVRRLEQEGKISLRTEQEQKRGIIIEGRLEKLVISRESTEQNGKINQQQAVEFYRKGIKSYQSGNLDMAITEFQQCLNFNPTLWQVYQLLGNCYHSKGRTQEALTSYERALTLNPGNAQLRNWVTSLRPSR